MTGILFICQDFPKSAQEPIVSGAVKNPYNTICGLIAHGYCGTVLSFDRLSHSGVTTLPRGSRVIRFRAPMLKLVLRTLYLNLASLWLVFRNAQLVAAVQAHHPHYALQMAFLKKLGLVKTRFIVKAHGTAVPELAANRYRGLRGAVLRVNAAMHLRLDRFVLSQADMVLVSSEYQRAEMAALYGVTNDRSLVFYNGATATLRRMRARSREQKDDCKHLLFVGRIVPKKGGLYFLQLVTELQNRGLRIRATMILGRLCDVEDPPTLASIRDKAQEVPGVRLVFDVPEVQMPEHFGAADALVVPSNGYESIPTVVLEGIVAGIPVFATYQWGIPEVLREEFGLTLKLSDDTERIYSFFSEHSSPVQHDARRAHFDWTYRVKQYMQLYGGANP